MKRTDVNVLLHLDCNKFSSFFRFSKRSYHSYESNSLPEGLITNGSNKYSCLDDFMELQKTWFGIKRRIESIKSKVKHIRKGLVSVPNRTKKVGSHMKSIDSDLYEILELVTKQQKITSYERPLGDILKPVSTKITVFHKKSTNIVL